MSKTYMKKEKGDGAIVCVALNEWPRYRASGYVFVETDEDGNTAAQQFVQQTTNTPAVKREAAPAAKKKASKKKKK